MLINSWLKWTKGRRSNNIIWERIPSLNHQVFTKKLSRSVAQEQKLFLVTKSELKDSLRMLRLFPHALSVDPDISTFFFIFSACTQLILSLLFVTLYISVKSLLNRLFFKVFNLRLFIRSSFSSFSNPNGILVALLWTLSILSISSFKWGFHACTASVASLGKHTNRSKARNYYSQI